MVRDLIRRAGEGDEAAGRALQAAIERASAGDRALARAICEAICPSVQAAAARALSRRGKAASRHDLQDLVGEVMVRLLNDRWALLRRWSPDRDPSLLRYVSLVARTTTFSVLRRAWWKNEDLTVDAPARDAHGADDAPKDVPSTEDRDDAEHRLAQHELLLAVVAGMEAELSPLGRTVLRLFLEGRSTEEIRVGAALDSASAVHTWRTRLGRLAEDVSRRLLDDASGPPASRVTGRGPSAGVPSDAWDVLAEDTGS